MLEAVSWFLMFFVTHLLDCIFFSRILEKENMKITWKLVILLVLFSILDCYIDKILGEEIRTLATNINAVVLLKILYNRSIVKTIIFSLASYMIYAISSVATMVLFTKIGNVPQSKLMMDGIEMYMSNLSISIIYVIIITRDLVISGIEKTISWYKENEIINTLVLVGIAVLYLYGLGYSLLIKEYEMDLIIVFLIFFVCSVIFVSGFFKQRSENNELKERYKASNDYAKTYERMATTKAKELHEHENQLVTMRGLADKKNQKLIDYIDKAIHKVAETEDQDYNHKLVNIPDGGLKGLIGYKIDTMLSEKMEVYVRVSDKLSEVSLWKNLENNLRDISMILGIYIDNAIEAARESKNKYIVIEVMYEEEEIVFEISNTYQEEVEEVGREGYTTKGIGRGNGLTLVRDIIDKNDRVRDEREVVGSYYVQKLIYQPK